MNGKYILQNGEPVQCDDLLTWARWFEDADQERIVQQDTIDDLLVSTVFLGLDHSFGGGSPLLYETMILGDDNSGEYQERYATRAEAAEGHTRALAHAIALRRSC